MQKRFISIWFHHLKTDWFIRRKPYLKDFPFVLSAPDHGRIIVTATNIQAEKEGIFKGMAVADARAAIPSLEVLDDNPGYENKLLSSFAEWLIRYSPICAIDLPDSITIDITGCAHLWGGEKEYLTNIINRLKGFGYYTRAAIADTIGTAWATAHFKSAGIVPYGKQVEALQSLPPAALRIEKEISERLEKLGLVTISDFISMPRPALRRRFGSGLLKRLDQALGLEEESIIPILPIQPYQERLPCLEPIVTATGIEIALQKLLEDLCLRLNKEGKGLRTANFNAYRIDGKIEMIQIGTNRPSCNTKHLFKLFEIKIDSIEPSLGIELFTINAANVEDMATVQEKLWDNYGSLNDINLSELLDRIQGKIGPDHINRFVPDQHYWPERSFKLANDIYEKPQTAWKVDRPRPIQLLFKPQIIEVTAPVPDYPPMSFRYKGVFHKITKADGPERIEQEWWLQNGQHRDYYTVEDEYGKRYWLFRSGHYDTAKSYQWFIHGFFP
ncbi:MAG: DNA polymerase Y family protein [Ginsengibacter sp.]